MDTIILAIDPSVRLLGKRTITQFRCIPYVASPLDTHRRGSGASRSDRKVEGISRAATCEVEKRRK